MAENNYMVSVEQALKIIDNKVEEKRTSEVCSVHQALGKVLSCAVHSPINMPPFRQSAMDGYAVCLQDTNTYTMVGEVKAGDAHQPDLVPGQAVRIFTGAMVPDSANAVVMQEKATRKDDTVVFDGEIVENVNIRAEAEQIKQGEIAIEKGELLKPATLSFLQGLGITEVEVVKELSVGIVITGDELVDAGTTLEKGKIYESNGLMLQSALKEAGIEQAEIIRIKDDYEQTVSVLRKTVDTYDLVLISGGISVGEYDFSGKALEEIGVEQLFYKVRQKPGKPLFFGQKEETFVFSLPGNPAAALTCFYIYVLRAIHLLNGQNNNGLTQTKLPLEKAYKKKGDRAQFLKAGITNEGVELLNHQSSAMLRSFAHSNALVFIPETTSEIVAGEAVDVYLLP